MDMRAVLHKIAESLEGDISIDPDWLSEHVSVLPEDRVRIDPVWAQVAGHIERREAMRADYQLKLPPQKESCHDEKVSH
jgi:hypothetical protein